VLPKTLIKGFDKGRLKWLLAVFFLAMAVPTGALIWQAYSQLKWEAFHQYRGLAEDLTGRVDAQLTEMIATADARSFADYTFLNLTGETAYKFVERSPLSAYPVTEDLPGVMGYFQVDSNGSFSTPLLPPEGADAEKLGIGADEYDNRLKLAQEIQTVLAENRLVQTRADVGMRRDLLVPAEEAKADVEQDAKEQDELDGAESRSRQVTPGLESAPASLVVASSAAVEEETVGGFLDETSADKNAADDHAAEPEIIEGFTDTSYSQQVFDELNQPRAAVAESPSIVGISGLIDTPARAPAENQRSNTIGKVADLNLDADLQKKSESVERAGEEQRLEAGRNYTLNRAKRREQIELPEAAAPADTQAIANVTGPTDLRISTFESEIDPLEFSLLDSGHFVLFRNVWREGERFIQGLLVDQRTFVSGAIERTFHASPLSEMTNLIVGYRDDVIGFFPGPAYSGYPGSAGELQGALLYSSRLSAPLDGLELIFSVNQLPQGPGAAVLGWVTLVLAMVFAGGFITLYRLGLSQINLARQQQDFVSAVSHELKTPLTSIRMYGEMLKEGWADEGSRATNRTST
jgi:hypothetical protein